MTTFERDGKTYVAIDSLTNWDKNPRSITKDDFARLKKHIAKRGQFKPLIITTDGTVLGGNMRLRAFQDLGIKDIWVSVVDAPNNKAKLEYALLDNDRAGSYDEQSLAELVTNTPDIELGDYKVDLGDPVDLSALLDKFGPDPDIEEDEAPEVDESEPAKSRLGEVYQLGRHRVMCGDSSDENQLATLIDGTSIDVLMTDPPYGINVEKMTLGIGKKEFHRGAWDTERPDLSNIITLADRVCVWGGNYFADVLPVTNDWLCWHKKNDGRSFSEFELAWTNFDCNTRLLSHHWGGEEKAHPTQKPLKVVLWALDHVQQSKTVLDLYGGSGSTLIACEQTNRTCYMMELDPRYVDVIIKRWENLTGQTAVKLEDDAQAEAA